MMVPTMSHKHGWNFRELSFLVGAFLVRALWVFAMSAKLGAVG